MPQYLTPGVYVEEVPGGPAPIEAVGTSTPAFIGSVDSPGAPTDTPVAINDWTHYKRVFPYDGPSSPLSLAVSGFFDNGGQRCYVLNIGPDGTLRGTSRRPGISSLEEIDEIAIVAAPGFTDAASYETVLTHCEGMGDRVAILDAPRDITDIMDLTKVGTSEPVKPTRTSAAGEAPDGADAGDSAASAGTSSTTAAAPPRSGPRTGAAPRQSSWGSVYFPYLRVIDPSTGVEVDAPPSGHIAGIWARTDSERGVHKAPANEPVRGAVNLTYRLTSAEQGQLNTAGVNAIRFFSALGIRVWGARTLAGSASEWRYLNVRRLFAMVEESIQQNTNWIVFEPNDPTLWSRIRRDIGEFLERLWRDGALLGASASQAFFVKCDAETNPPEQIDAGIVTTLVGMAPVKPAEFIVFKVSQYAGGATVEQEA